MRNNAAEILRRAAKKYRATAPLATHDDQLPYRGGEGWLASPFDGNSWWTGGFWPGLMWLLWSASGDDWFRDEALRSEDLLTAEFRTFEKLNHDVGFMYLLSCGAHFKMLGDPQAGTDTLHAANLLMGRFNPKGYIRAWNERERVGFAIIDCLMNLSLLFWASDVTGDPRFAHVARAHADTTLREFVREDGSVCHIVEFDPMTGARVREHGGQGYAEGTAWSRGQAWALYGFVLAHANTGEARYLEASRRVAGFFMEHIREDGLTNCDFLQPDSPERIDNIAGACAACGLIELHRQTGDGRYLAAAEKLLDGLIDHCCDWSEEKCGLLTKCTASYHDDAAGVHTNIVYGDYFFVEALAKLAGCDPMIWRAEDKAHD